MKTTDTLDRTRYGMGSILLAVLMLGAGLAMADETRVAETREGAAAVRDGAGSNVVTRHEYGPLTAEGKRSAGPTVAAGKPGAAVATAPNVDFWFYTADVVLFNDHDNDGYYYGIDLLFDADTYYDYADVYAVLYLSRDGGPWNEYAVTEDFTIFGTSAEDEYVVVSELLAGYPSGSYDLLIELYDAWDGSFLAWIGPEHSSELAFLPVEDAERDAPYVAPDVVIVHEHGGGAAGLFWLLAMSAFAVARFGRARCA